MEQEISRDYETIQGEASLWMSETISLIDLVYPDYTESAWEGRSDFIWMSPLAPPLILV